MGFSRNEKWVYENISLFLSFFVAVWASSSVTLTPIWLLYDNPNLNPNLQPQPNSNPAYVVRLQKIWDHWVILQTHLQSEVLITSASILVCTCKASSLFEGAYKLHKLWQNILRQIRKLTIQHICDAAHRKGAFFFLALRLWAFRYRKNIQKIIKKTAFLILFRMYNLNAFIKIDLACKAPAPLFRWAASHLRVLWFASYFR